LSNISGNILYFSIRGKNGWFTAREITASLLGIGCGYFFSFRLYLVRERFEKYPDGRRKLHGKEKSSPVNGTWDIVRYGI